MDVSRETSTLKRALLIGGATPYDNLNRLTSATVALTPTPLVKSFSYSAIGNIVSKSDVGTYTYPAAGQPLLQLRPAACRHDLLATRVGDGHADIAAVVSAAAVVGGERLVPVGEEGPRSGSTRTLARQLPRALALATSSKRDDSPRAVTGWSAQVAAVAVEAVAAISIADAASGSS